MKYLIGGSPVCLLLYGLLCREFRVSSRFGGSVARRTGVPHSVAVLVYGLAPAAYLYASFYAVRPHVSSREPLEAGYELNGVGVNETYTFLAYFPILKK
jgi:hypothetical protein